MSESALSHMPHMNRDKKTETENRIREVLSRYRERVASLLEKRKNIIDDFRHAVEEERRRRIEREINELP